MNVQYQMLDILDFVDKGAEVADVCSRCVSFDDVWRGIDPTARKLPDVPPLRLATILSIVGIGVPSSRSRQDFGSVLAWGCQTLASSATWRCYPNAV